MFNNKQKGIIMAEISVIIPCHNQEKYIAETIESVVAQTFNDIEIIVVNDGSSDNSLEIIKDYAAKYPHKIRLINQQNQGVISARNNAISQANGTYVFPLDGDDKIAPDCLEKLYHAMINHKGDVIYCIGKYFGNKNETINERAATKFNMCTRNRVHVSALYRKEDWKKYGGYDQAMKDGLEDWEFWLNFVEDDKSFYKINEPLFFYRNLDVSRNSGISKSTEQKLIKIIKNKHKKLFDWKFNLMFLLRKITRFLYQKKITKSGKMLIKICKIPVYSKRTDKCKDTN